MAGLNDWQECKECGEFEAHGFHLDDPHGFANRFNPFDCNYDASWEGEETGFVGSCDHHEFEPGCFCGDSGRCSVCVSSAIEQAEYLRDAMTEESYG